MRAWRLAGVAAWALVANTPLAAQIVQTDAGAVRGTYEGAAMVFRGMAYAAPPVGALRWQAAQPVQPWQDVRDATQFGSDCIQAGREDGLKPGIRQSEDCLTLNVVAPRAKQGKKPVLVLIHGGAFAFGTGRKAVEEGLSAFTKAGIVVVSPNYRVGRMGFFAHPDMAAGSTRNYWLSDQIAALQWVQRNIKKFGGDSSNVTILGCSAGGSSINALMASPAARGLFAKAVARSGGGFFNATRALATAETQAVAFAARAGIGAQDAEAMHKLRALTPAQIIAADPGPPNYGAIIDGALLDRQISQSFAQGLMAHVPFIVGSTSNEASVFGLMGFDAAALKSRFGIDMEALRPFYDAPTPASDAELLRQIQTDFIFTSASLGMARLAARNGLPTYAYHFDWVAPAKRATLPGAPHCSDMPYLLGQVQSDDPAEQKMMRAMNGSLIAFLRTGKPAFASWPTWQPATAQDARPLVIGLETEQKPGFRRRQLTPYYDMWSKLMRESLDR